MESIVVSDGATTIDILKAINKARDVFAKLKGVWRSKNLKLKTKIKLCNCTVNPVLLSGYYKEGLKFVTYEISWEYGGQARD